MTQEFVPTIGESGFYHLLAPFTIERENTIYTCKAIRKISELLDEGVEVYNVVYNPHGVTVDIYEEDVAADRSIIYLQSSNNRWITVPSRYLAGYPNMNGVPYRRVSVVLSLPAFTLDQDFSNAITQLRETVQMTLGVDSQANVVITSESMLVEDTDHKLLQAQRQTEMEKSTPSSRANFWRRAYDDLLVKYNAIVNTLV